MTEKQSVLGVVSLKWEVNIGLPTKSHTDEALRKIYLELVGEAWAMSTDPHFGGEGDRESNNVERKLHSDLIKAFPEFVAQIQGYISSRQRKCGIHTLVDVGAGTIDATVFNVHKEKGENKHIILAASVKRLGTTCLANHRCGKLRQSSDWRLSPQDLFPSPDEFARKLGVTLQQINDVDKGFKKMVRDQIHSLLKYTKQVMAPTPILQTYERESDIYHAKEMDTKQPDRESGVPLMLCGGGARVKFYKKVISILTDSRQGYPLQEFPLPALDNLDAPGLLEEDSDRLSVAYGLSFNEFQIGEITFPDPPSSETENAGQRKSCTKCNGIGGGYGNCTECGGRGFSDS